MTPNTENGTALANTVTTTEAISPDTLPTTTSTEARPPADTLANDPITEVAPVPETNPVVLQEETPEEVEQQSDNPINEVAITVTTQEIAEVSVGQSIVWPETIVPPDVLDDLRILQMEIRDLQIHIQRILKNEATLQLSQQYIQKTRSDISRILDVSDDAQYSRMERKLRREIDRIKAEIPKADKDEQAKKEKHLVHLATLKPAFRHLQNIWEQMKMSALMNDTPDLQGEQLTRQLQLMDARLRRMNFQIVVFTIPTDIRRWLEGSRSGYYIPFHEFFAEDLPDYDDRVNLLKRLAWTPTVLSGGLIDVDNGLIFRYSTEPTHLMWSPINIGMTILILFALIVAIGEVFNWSSSGDIVGTLVSWVALLVGVIFHLMIGTLKSNRPPIIAIGEFPLLLNAKFGSIMVKLLWAFVGFVAYTYMSETGVAIPTALNYFLVGYGLDSFVGIFGNQLTTISKTQFEAMSVSGNK